MGRWGSSGKQEADGLKKIDIRYLNKQGLLKGWRSTTLSWSRGGQSSGSVGLEVSVMGDIQKYYRDEPPGEPYIRIHYTQTDNTSGEKKDFDYKILLVTTPCRFGGMRYWFRCPWYRNGVYCSRRVGTLYMAGDYFACRHCYDLTYTSRNLGGRSKIAGQVISIPELEELEKSVRVKHYAGKPTKRYLRLLKKQDKADRQLMIMVGGFDRSFREKVERVTGKDWKEAMKY